MNDIYSHIDRLQELPLLQGTPLHGSTRVLHHPPYLIHYLTDEDNQAVYIRRIKDGRRR
jgi:plasmid stabilization system protein ParE